MGATYRILPAHGVVYVRFHDVVTPQESLDLFGAYIRDPGFRAGQKQLIDLSAVTELVRDIPKILEMQAVKAAQMDSMSAQTMMAYYAPTDLGRMMAAMSVRAWDGFDQVASRVVISETDALAFLGLKETRISDLLTNARA